jgi:phosphorylcholine metabolism protein LicD
MNLIFIILSLIIVITYIYISNKEIEYIDNSKTNELYNLLQNIICILNVSKVDYIIIGGTLLGSIRHGGLIPWDDDADLAILDKSPKEIFDILQPLSKYNVYIYESKMGNLVKVKMPNSNIVIDIFPMEKNNNNIYKFKLPYDIIYKNEYFPEEEIYPIKKYKFGPLLLRGPNNAINYLNRTYPNWKTIAKKWNSKTNIFYKNEEVILDYDAKIPDSNFKKIECEIT